MTNYTTPNNATIMTQLNCDGYYEIPSLNIHCWPFSITAGQSIQFQTVQTANTEDFSLRCCFSTLPAGPSINPIYPLLSYFCLTRVLVSRVLKDPAALLPGDNKNFVITPGVQYFLNIENLENALNGYRLLMVIAQPGELFPNSTIFGETNQPLSNASWTTFNSFS